MVKQGDIIKLDFNPQLGHEQAGYRPAVIISNNFFNTHSNLTIVCPITNTARAYPLHIPLDSRTATTGVVMCDQLKTVDLSHRTHRFTEKLPIDILNQVLEAVFSTIEKSE